MGLSLKGIDKYVDSEMHLSGIDLDLDIGSRYVVLGRTLAGKTSLLRIMCGLDRPTRGHVLVDGTNVTGTSVRKRDVAMVYQQFINYPSLTVFQNIASPLRTSGTPKDEIDRRVREAASMLSLDSMLDRLPAELSGGQQQRTAIARALVKESQLLLLDEPLVNLDYKLREALRDELLQIFERRDSMVVYTTTEPTEALMLGGNIIVMHEGRVLQTGPTMEVYQRPATTKVAEVFSDPPINFVRVIVGQGQGHLRIGIDFPLTGHLADLPEGEYNLGIRPNNFYSRRHREDDLVFEARVELAEINGSETFIHFHYRNRALVMEESGVRSMTVGDDVSVYVNPCDFYVFDMEGRLLKGPGDQGAACSPPLGS